MNYRREIDGLRAIAVLPVILFHAGFQTFSGGFVGVDVFFVISGYLITTIILAELEQGKFSIINFYERRARRIVPALFFVMAVCIPLAWVTLPPADLGSFSKSLVAVPLFLSNLFFWRDGGYFETAAELKPLLHTWSLAVEEQYYVLFPLFLILTWRLGKRWIVSLIIVVAALSLLLAQIGSSYRPTPNFFLLPTRAWELAIGVLIAFYFDSGRRVEMVRSSREIFSFLGLALVLFSVFTFQKNTPFPSFYTLVPTIGAALIILFAKPDTFVGNALGSKFLVGIGLISYSAYLWHQPLFAFARHHYSSPSVVITLGLALSSLLLAVFSWRFIEKPFRAKGVFTRKFVFSFSLVFGLALVIFGLGSANIFGNSSSYGVESKTASTLTKSKAVFSSNMDERIFIKFRIQYEDLSPNVIVVGSSRIMQIGEHNYNGKVLNLGVSGSSVEDEVAITHMATKKFQPSTILVGADPWLFNAKSGQNRWKSLNKEYEEAVSLNQTPARSSADAGHIQAEENSFFLRAGNRIYQLVNHSKLNAGNDFPEIKNKIRRDGSLVYNTTYARKTQIEIERGFNELLNYAMNPYAFSEEAKFDFERFIKRYRGKYNVVLVLAPYHPKLFERMKKERSIYLEIESEFRKLAVRNGAVIIGSYDPVKVGCADGDFYDGMHPKDICMERVLSELKVQ